MRCLCLPRVWVGIALLATMGASAAPAPPPITWRTTWNAALFTQAAKEHRFVLLDLHAVWCHWCHVMDDTTYVDAEVERLIGQSYLSVSIDADSDPDLTSRYGNWGWPATIVLAADGTEIVKRRGYLTPQQMASLLQAIIDDPSPGPSIQQAAPLPKTDKTQLTLRSDLHSSKPTMSCTTLTTAGGGAHKLIDADSMQLAYLCVDSARTALKVARSRHLARFG